MLQAAAMAAVLRHHRIALLDGDFVERQARPHARPCLRAACGSNLTSSSTMMQAARHERIYMARDGLGIERQEQLDGLFDRVDRFIADADGEIVVPAANA